MKAGQRLVNFLKEFQAEPLTITRVVDTQRRLSQSFDRDFPLLMRFYTFPAYRQMLGDKWLNWHSHLELIVPITGAGRFCVGAHIVDFRPGDILLVDNMKLHGMLDLDGEHRSLVIFFMPELVYGTGSCACDAAFLTPFWERADSAPPILRSSDPLAAEVHAALMELVKGYFGPGDSTDKRVLCKLRLLEVLYGLRQHFATAGSVGIQHGEHRRRLDRLQKLFQHLSADGTAKIPLSKAAALVGMSTTRFKVFFKETTGTTFARYVVQLRLGRACQMLRDTDCAIGLIAQESGFCDQSHLDNHFRKALHLSPKEYRARHRTESQGGRFIQGLRPNVQDAAPAHP